MKPLVWLNLVFLSTLTGCGGLLGSKKESPSQASPSPFGATGIPPQMRATTQDSGTPVTPSGTPPADAATKITPDEDIVFTDPDNPDATLPDLSTLLTTPKRRGPWEDSETIAKKRAAREGKPLLIWFTDSARSPMCKALNQELFSKPDFDSWATEKIIRLRVDANIDVNDPNLSMDEKNTRVANLKSYVARMKKTYKVLGQPSLLMLNPSGEVIGRYRGYQRGQADFYWGLIKQGEAASAATYQQWRADLEKKGYREWTDLKDRKVFARLTGYSNGSLNLIEPDGTRSRTQENKLSQKDREWIDSQKKLRGL